jgi:hypothetical protein
LFIFFPVLIGPKKIIEDVFCIHLLSFLPGISRPGSAVDYSVTLHVSSLACKASAFALTLSATLPARLLANLRSLSISAWIAGTLS